MMERYPILPRRMNWSVYSVSNNCSEDIVDRHNTVLPNYLRCALREVQCEAGLVRTQVIDIED